MILSFACKETWKIFNGVRSLELAGNIQETAFRKLAQMDQARFLDDLRIPPGNRLELLRGKHRGRYSLRINDQWRICFRWTDKGPADVEIVDYH